MAKGYLIAEIEVENAEQYAKYTAQTPAAVAKHGGKFVVRGGTWDAVEGAPPQGRIVVIEFPSFEAARTFYQSADYQPLIPIRQSASSGRVFLVEGADA